MRKPFAGSVLLPARDLHAGGVSPFCLRRARWGGASSADWLARPSFQALMLLNAIVALIGYQRAEANANA